MLFFNHPTKGGVSMMTDSTICPESNAEHCLTSSVITCVLLICPLCVPLVFSRISYICRIDAITLAIIPIYHIFSNYVMDGITTPNTIVMMASRAISKQLETT